MFIGHFAAGFGAKTAAPATSLGTLLLAAQFLDLLWPTLLLAGVEEVRIAPGTTVVTPLDFTYYPVSHGLVGVLAWAALAGGAYWWTSAVRGNAQPLVSGSAQPAGRNAPALWRQAPALRSPALVVALLVVSHWVLDLVVHRPDLPLAGPGSPRVGLGLWNSLPATVAVEGALLAAGAWLYLRTTRPRDRAGALGFWALVALLVVIHAANLSGPPPPSVAAIAWVGQAQWLLVAMGWWVDRHREPSSWRNAPALRPTAQPRP